MTSLLLRSTESRNMAGAWPFILSRNARKMIHHVFVYCRVRLANNRGSRAPSAPAVTTLAVFAPQNVSANSEQSLHRTVRALFVQDFSLVAGDVHSVRAREQAIPAYRRRSRAVGRRSVY
ncbi:hypothetical protein EVAR_28272_1 [Eumeta japonica]|uniref:Uncharacterized protein n=1 Tax=Eumeta variegata TaxID=151549 RepID=A0A4C1V769_EUMVA|nr:hypothetical protein EVAR_28272_1 [Eumeta japonica]